MVVKIPQMFDYTMYPFLNIQPIDYTVERKDGKVTINEDAKEDIWCFPITSFVTEGYTFDWSAETAFSGTGEMMTKVAGQIAETVMTGLLSTVGIVDKSGKIAEIAKKSIMYNNKVAINDFKKQMFGGHNFREFDISFAFTPESAEDTMNVEGFIKKFRWYALPSLDSSFDTKIFGEVSTDTALISYPNYFYVNFYTNDNTKSSNKAKELFSVTKMVCTKFNVKRGNEDGLITFIDGNPVVYSIDMSFREILRPFKDKNYGYTFA